ncbi:hypothetical protein ACEPAI_3904 [Sanghuangporus weigelae]
MPGLDSQLPPFPDDVPTHPLSVIDYVLISSGDSLEIEKLWEAATNLGFWYLKNHIADREIKEMFKIGAETMRLLLDEKMQFERGDSGQSFGYKAAGLNAIDEKGNLYTAESINISKDDALAYPEVVHRTYPSTVNNRMDSTLKPFVRKSVEVINTILSIFEEKLGLPAGTLLNLHSVDKPSGSEARCIKSPPRRVHPAASEEKIKVSLGAHTDFGSLSFLHIRLGGLQVLPPGSAEWRHVRPLPGHAICNVGDTLTLLSGGILRSNLHRVVPAPGAQAAYTRWSLVFFMRPGNDVYLRPLADESEVVRIAVAGMNEEVRKMYHPDATAREWYARRIMNQMVKNRTSPETWRASRGMEHTPGAT